ncbi:MAG: DUF177 domain-containing protein [Candidatus Bipolaricaulia bacterium]
MWLFVSARMPLSVRKFVDNPGNRFQILLTLPGSGEADDELRVVERISLDGEGFAQLSTLYLAVQITAGIRQPCRRCLTPVTTTVELEEEFEVPIPPGTDSVELWPDVLRLVLSAHDPNVVCREDCRGLCPVCGANLNREPNHSCQDSPDETRRLRDLVSWKNDS